MSFMIACDVTNRPLLKIKCFFKLLKKTKINSEGECPHDWGDGGWLVTEVFFFLLMVQVVISFSVC